VDGVIMKKPNLLWIITDQQSANMMSCMGNQYVKTPNMDYLARKGILFENAYCTNPVCLPSRFSLFTGLYPGDIGVRSNEYQNEAVGLPSYILENGLGKLLKKQGYAAVYGGKEHLPFMDAAQLGFDYICQDEREILATELSDYIRYYNSEQPFAMVASFINPHDICFMAIDDFADEEGAVADYFRTYFKDDIACLREHEKLPKDMHPDIFYECVCPPLPDNHMPAKDEPEAIRMMQNDRNFKKLARERYSDQRWRLHRWAYANLTQKVDRQIGIVLRALIDAGLWDDTVIIFTSDHGDLDASHKMEHKTALYQECCRIPLIIKGIEKNFANRTSQRLVSNGLDCICTLMDYAGISKPDYLNGLSLMPLVENIAEINPDWRNVLMIESEYGLAAIGGHYKYVQYFNGARREQFYDLSVNPGEQYNQIAEIRYLDHITQLKDAVKKHKRCH